MMKTNTLRAYAIAFIITTAFLIADLNVLLASNDSQQQANLSQANSYTVVFSDAFSEPEITRLPKQIKVGDSIVWQNLGSQTIMVEQVAGFRVFLPVIQAAVNNNTESENKAPTPTPTSNNNIGDAPVAAWFIEPGESFTMRYDNANFYTLNIITDSTLALQLLVTE